MLPLGQRTESFFCGWSVENFHLSYTVETLCGIFCCALNLAEILPLQQIFVDLTFEMTPSPTYLFAQCVSCRDARFESSSIGDPFLLCRDMRVNVKLEIPIAVPERLKPSLFPYVFHVFVINKCII
jgi:hypothetical protein